MRDGLYWMGARSHLFPALSALGETGGAAERRRWRRDDGGAVGGGRGVLSGFWTGVGSVWGGAGSVWIGDRGGVLEGLGSRTYQRVDRAMGIGGRRRRWWSRRLDRRRDNVDRGVSG